MGIELTPVEKLAVAQAFYKRAAEAVSTKDPDSLRGQADEFYRGMYEQTGAKSFDVKLLGRKVGTYSVVTTKARDGGERVELKVTDVDAYMSWALLHGYFSVDEDAVREHFESSGEVPDGCEAVTVSVTGAPGGEFKGTKLVIDPQAVADALGPALTDAGTVLLMEGGD